MQKKSTLPLDRQQGFTLMEVLIAVLILSFGMLGLVGMQAFALQSNREAKLYSEATNLARELTEMMRGNNLVAIETEKAANPYLLDIKTDTEPAEDCLTVGSSCTTTKDVAAAQMTEWVSRLKDKLPGARATICFDSTPYDSNGLPQWDCTADTTATDAVIFVKLGWTLRSTDSSADNASATIQANSDASRPQIILPITGGNPFPSEP